MTTMKNHRTSSSPMVFWMLMAALSCGSSPDVMAFVPQQLATKTSTATLPSATSLSMMSSSGNLFDRFSRVVKSNMNKFISGLENPEKVIVQAVDDMQNDLVKVRQAYAEAVATQRRLQRQYDQADTVAADWYRKAQLALENQNEGLAKTALTYRQTALDKADGLRSQLETQTMAVDGLYRAMQQLEEKIAEAVTKKQQLVARAKTAQTTQAVNDMLSGLPTGKSAMSAFVRMEEKVEALEAAAEVSTTLALEPATSAPLSLETEFLKLEQSSKVDDELQRMKESMKLLRPSSTSSTSTSVGINKERVSVPAGRGETILIQ